MKKIQVVVGDPLPVTLQGIDATLKTTKDIEIVGLAATGKEALSLVLDRQPDVAVIAINFPDYSGLRILKDLQGQEMRTVVFTAEQQPEIILDAMLLGAQGYLLKWDHALHLPRMIRDAAKGKTVMCQMGLQGLVEAARERMTPRRASGSLLKPRELEVLVLLADGRTNPQIAEALVLEVSTVRTHVRNVYHRLGTHNRAETIKQARRLGLLTN